METASYNGLNLTENIPIFRQTLGFSDETDFPNVLDSWYNTVSEIDMDMVNQAYEAHLFHSHPYDIEYRSKKKIILSNGSMSEQRR